MGNILGNIAEIVLCGYAIVKHIIGINFQNPVFFVCEQMLYLILSVILFITITLLMLPFVLIRELINVYLKRKIGSKYKGILCGMDAIWYGDIEAAKHIINSIAFVQIRTSPQDFIVYLKQIVKDTQDIRFNSTMCSTLGYYYRVYSDNIPDNAMGIIKLTADELSSKQSFEDKISSLANKPLPSLCPYEVLVSEEPVNFYGMENGETKNYVVIVRMHHSLGDATSLLNYLLRIVDDDENSNESRKLLMHYNTVFEKAKKEKIDSLRRSLPNYLDYVWYILKNTSIHFFNLLRKHDNNILHGSKLSGEKILVYNIEDTEYLSKIKSIKSEYKDCRFCDVVYTALSASLWEHFAQHAERIPENIHISFISRIKNDMSALTLDIPINISGISPTDNLEQRLNLIKTRHKRVCQSIENLVFFWMCRMVSLFPVFLSRSMCALIMKTTSSFSNVPGIKRIKIDSNYVTDIVFWTPTVIKTGMGFTVLSYGGRLQLGLIVDKIFIHKEEASLILRNVHKYIDLLTRIPKKIPKQ